MDVLKPCMEPLLSCLRVHVGFLINAKMNVDMNHTVALLSAKKRDVETELEGAERNNQQPTQEVNLWLKEVAELEAKVPAVNEDYEQIGLRHPLHNFILFTSWPTFHGCGSRAATLQEEAAKLVQERASIPALTICRGLDRVQRIPSPQSYVGKAIERNLKRVLYHLQDEKVGVIGIWGQGGVGKTTLLGRINKSSMVDGNLGFDHVIWVVASQPLQLEKLQKDIAERLGVSSPVPSEIFKCLEHKNFLLLLDDLWEDFNLEEVGIPQPLCNIDECQKKQKVVLTTRFEGVCNRMQVDEAIKVECLGQKEALQLFGKALGKISISNPEIETLREKIVEECDGLPIALITIGKAMSGKKTVHQWKDTLYRLQSHTSSIRGMDRVFSRLKISYDSLEDDTEKECFLYCSLWPEDEEIKEKQLIWCWLGHGIIDLEEFETFEAAFDRGHSIIETLKDACLLEAGKPTIVNMREKLNYFRKMTGEVTIDLPFHTEEENDTIKMHDIIRDLAVQVVRERGSKWLLKQVQDEGLANLLSFAKWKEAEKVWLILSSSDDSDIWLPPPHCPNLSTLLLAGWGGNLQFDFLSCFPALKFLDLSQCYIYELPAVIGCLLELEFLNLSGTEITELPDELANLSKLKYLILRNKEHEILIPTSVILRLQKLLVLDATGTGVLKYYQDQTKDVFVALRRMKLVSLKEFNISSLGPDVKLLSHVKVEKLLISDSGTEGRKTFCLKVLSNGMQQTKWLEITDCVVLEKLVMEGSCFPSLKCLSLKMISMLREII